MDDPECDALEVVDWWIGSTTFGMSGPSGPPEWPEPGGLLNQDARLVDAVQVLRSHWPHVIEKPDKKAPEPMTRRRRT